MQVATAAPQLYFTRLYPSSVHFSWLNSIQFQFQPESASASQPQLLSFSFIFIFIFSLKLFVLVKSEPNGAFLIYL